MDLAKNLLIIMSDEHRRDAMGCMGHPIVKTPHLDRLAAQGAVFENAYTPSPICVPARAAFATGSPVHECGYWDSATPYDGTRRSWMHDLRDSGREVVSIGKLHFRSGAEDNGFSEEILPMHVVGGVGWPVGLLRKDPPEYNSAAELAADVGVGRSTYTDYDLAITAAAQSWLGNRNDRPWAAFVSLVSPHYPLTCPQEFYELYDPAFMDVPVGWQELPDHPEVQNLAGFFDYDQYFDKELMRKAKAAYYGLTSFMDDCVGRVLAALEASGQAQETLVIYVSDHGDMMGDHGMWTKQVMYEASAGVPMIVAGPDIPAGRRVKTAASLLDVAATARGLARGGGAGVIELATRPDDAARVAFSEYHDGGSQTGAFMVRWDRWKFVYYVGHSPQLFDLEADPNEMMDVAADATFAEVLSEGEALLRGICDPEVVNERAFADQAVRIAQLGGVEACQTAFVFNHTPTPNEQEKMK